MEVKLSGRSTSVRSVHWKKALSVMAVRAVQPDRSTEVRAVPKKALFPMEVRALQSDRSTEVSFVQL